MKVGDLVEKIHGLVNLGMMGIIIDFAEDPDDMFVRGKATVYTEKGKRRWFTTSIQVIHLDK